MQEWEDRESRSRPGRHSVRLSQQPAGFPCSATRSQASHGIYWTSRAAELCLLAKAVVVAVLGEERVLPPPPPPSGSSEPSEPCGDVGLLCMYVSIVAALLGSFLESALALSWVAKARKRHEAADEARSAAAAADGGSAGVREPLLGKKGDGETVSGCVACGWGHGSRPPWLLPTDAPCSCLHSPAAAHREPHDSGAGAPVGAGRSHPAAGLLRGRGGGAVPGAHPFLHGENHRLCEQLLS